MFNITRKLASISHIYVKWALLLLIGLAASVQLLRDPVATANYSSYDQMLKKRLWTAAVDPKIIIVDIDEASLNQLNREFGRWPWPRETLAAALEWLESKGTQAVVFDILFSDLDATHPQSDQAFADAVGQSRHSFFPILRLNPDNDGISQIRADQLPGFAQALANDPPPTLALVPPVFESVIQTQRLGYHNIYPDRDGINRHYDLWQDKDGWRLWSLPARLANEFGWDKGEKSRVLINFNHSPNAYQTVPFHEIWRLSQSREGMAADPRFAGAIVLIGSTASSLFDVKATPISSIHPGVHVLANAIDNVKNGNFIQELHHDFKFVTVWTCLLLMGLASSRMKTQVLRWSVLVIPTLLLAISYLSLHISHWFVDLSGPASHALLFFSVMSVYQNWRLNHFAEARPMLESQLAQGKQPLYQACVVASYGPENIKPQRLITHAATSGSPVAVVQAGWYGEFVGDQSGPSCVLLVNHNTHALADSIQQLLEKETPFILRHDVSDITPVDARIDFSSKDDSQVLWRAVAKALLKWENLQN
jgi:CHASE2 domain-containing sensor protein